MNNIKNDISLNIFCSCTPKTIKIVNNNISSFKKANLISKETGIPINYIYNEIIDNYIYDRTPNWICINKQWFYLKGELSNLDSFNELLGQEISLYFGLNSAKYEVAKIENNKKYEYRIISENSFDKKYHYYLCNELNITNDRKNLKQILLDIKRICINNNDNKFLLLKDIIKMCIRDLYSGHIDRHRFNFFFQQKKDTKNDIIRLAPLLDYGSSFDNDYPFYENSILELDLCNKDTMKIMNNEEFFQIFIDKLLMADMDDLLNKTEEKNNILISDKLKSFYLYKDQNIKKIIKKYK